MGDLIKALNIFLKYKDSYSPTHCEHDILYVVDVSYEEVSENDKEELEKLGFSWSSDDCWCSYRFGSA
jgi:hypothetical protein